MAALSTFPAVSWAFLALAALALAGFALGQARARRVGAAALHSLPEYHGQLAALWVAGPGLALTLLHILFSAPLIALLVARDLPAEFAPLTPLMRDTLIANAASAAAGTKVVDPSPLFGEITDRFRQMRGLGHLLLGAGILLFALGGMLVTLARPAGPLRARQKVEAAVKFALLSCSGIAIATTIGIVFSLVGPSLRFFAVYSPFDFLTGLNWSPQTAIRPDQVGQTGGFGAVKLFYGTLAISALAMLVAAPIGLFAAIWLSEYSGRRARAFVKPALEILAGIPSVVYGFFAAFTVAPLIQAGAAALGLEAAPQNMLAAGIVMGIMIIPLVSSLSDDVINAVPQALRDGSYALGSTKSETVKNVIIPAALPGIVGALLLAVSRALGETMIVAMAAGQRAQLTLNPLDEATTVTVWIVALLTGDQEFNSAKTLSAFALGFVLFIVTLILNVVALRVVQTFREKYD